jgi:Tol biopolymer transport system component
MKANPFSRNPTLGVLCFFLAVLKVAAQPLQIGPAQIINHMVQFQVRGATNVYHRVDVSYDMANWLPIDLYFDTNGLHNVQDAVDPASLTRFYRAAEVTPNPQILDFSPENGSAGTQVQIIGQFLPPAGQSVVEFGGVDAKVISGTSTRLVVLVPTNAVSSRVSVSSAAGTLTSDGAFVVLSNGIVRFQPPAGIQAKVFTIENNYASGVLISGTTADYSIPVRLGAPNLTFAVPTNSASNPLFFCALSFGAEKVIVMDANSTADALVFQSPFLFSSDPDLGPSLMSIIQTNAQVQAFAQTLAGTMTQSNDPLNDPAVSNAYEAAVVSVVSGEGVAALVASMPPMPAGNRGLRLPRTSGSGAVSFYPLEDLSTRWIDVTARGLTVSADIEEGYYNPVDRLVVYQDVDVDAAFPNGRLDFDRLTQVPEGTPQTYPARGVFYKERSIGANLATSRINLVATFVKYLVKLLDPKLVKDSVVLPSGDGLYLVRGVGPGERSLQDLGFVAVEMPDVYLRALSINIAAAALDLASAVLGDSAKDLLGQAGEIQSIAAEILKYAPGIRTRQDFVLAVYNVESTLVKNGVKGVLKDGMGVLVKRAGDSAVSINDKLKKISTWGQFGERVSGFVRTTALETTLVMVGDPFNLTILSVTPTNASPGQQITIQFKGSTNLHAFNSTSPTDKVAFQYNEVFNGEVTDVSGPDASGIQTLRVRIPAYLGSTHDGPYTMYVITQGRKGIAPFTISTEAKLTSVSPLQGFAATPNFRGSPYAGTVIRLQGALFTSTDQFLFKSGTGTVEATSKQNNGFYGGDVTLKVPAGASTGPISIVHQLIGGGTVLVTGPVFTVFGPPVINSVQPAAAPLGTVLNLSVDQAGNDSSVVYAQFTGGFAQNASIIADGTVLVVVPSGAQSGFLTISTPAGTNQVPFNILAGAPNTNQTGSVIIVSTNSHITVARAIAFANGDALPAGNETQFVSPGYVIVNGVGTWYVGRYFNDTISINEIVNEDVNFNMNFDSVGSGTFTGNVVISGNNEGFGPLVFNGPVLVTGVSNNFQGTTFNSTVTIAGSNNILSACTVQAPMVVTGDENSFYYPLFQGVAGNALTIKGNRNTGTIDLQTNQGDGLRIDGGKFNNITLNSCRGNLGNGVTLTGGAEGNTVTALSGASHPLSANARHGVALIGSAIANQILGPIGQNGLDGLYMDGPGVVLNSTLAECYLNGRNGVTVTNGAATNSIGNPASIGLSVAAQIHNNAGCGLVFANCGANLLAVYSISNGSYGVLASNVKAPPASFPINIVTSRNGAAGIRLENGTTGLVGPATLNSDHNGLEIGGMDVTNNQIGCAINTALGNGVVLAGGGYDGSIALTVQGCSGDGVLLQGLSNSLVSLHGVEFNTNNGVHITAGAYGNLVLATANDLLAAIDHNLNGCRVDSGSHDNILHSMYCNANRQDGIVFSGAGVMSNQFVHSSAVYSARDDVRFEQGASGNFIGSDDEGTTFGTGEISIQTSGGAGVRVTDPGTRGNVIRNCTIGQGYGYGQAYGVIVENQAEVGLITASSFVGNNNAIVIRSGAKNGTLKGLYFGQNTNDAVLIQDAASVLIGGDDDGAHNEFLQSTNGIEISGITATNNLIVNNHISYCTNGIFIHGGAQLNGVAQNNVVELNNIGVRLEAANSNQLSLSTVQNNADQGVSISQGSSNNIVNGDTITGNAIGVLVSDAGSVGNVISGNSITANTVIGIQLSAGGNTQIAPPVLADYAAMTVSGTSTAPDGSRVEIFRDAGDQGRLLLGAGDVVSGKFRVALDSEPSSLGLVFALNGTVTDPAGNTSQFSGLSQLGFPLPKVAFTASPTGHRQIFLSTGGGAPIILSSNAMDNFGPMLAGGVTCNKLLFVSLRSGNEDIFVMDAAAGALAQAVTTNLANDYDPAWLIPCQRIVFVSEKDGNPEIYAADLDGSNLLRLTTNNVADHQPAPTRDGSRIVFVSNRSGSDGLWVMNSNGSNQQPLSSGIIGTPSQPAVSPADDWVAMVVTQNGTSEIALVRTDGSDFRQLTSDGAHALHPTWLPDGEHLIFSSDRGGTTPELYYIDRSGSGGIQLLPLNPNTGSDPSAGGH